MAYYGVKKGRVPGVYTSWDECKIQVLGFAGAIYKKFSLEPDALRFVYDNDCSHPTQPQKFELNVSGKGKSQREKLVVGEAAKCLMAEQNDDLIVIDPDEEYKKMASDIATEPVATRNITKFHSTAPCVTLFTDGACSGNPGKGGYGYAVVINDKLALTGSGRLLATTNNQMELTAVIEGLKVIPKNYAVVVYSDSSYVVNAFNKNWIAGWQKRNWLTSNKEPVANRDLWEVLLETISELVSVQFVWVKGHAGNKYNELCDRLAVEAIRNLN